MNENTDYDTQIARTIYLRWMANMKFALDMEEYSYKDKGRNDARFKFFKKQLMQNTYDGLRELFADLEDIGVIVPTEYDEDVKDGYRETPSGGSGYTNASRFNAWVKRELSAGNE